MADQRDSLHPYRYEELAETYLEERSKPEWRPVRLGFGTVDAEIKGVSAGRVLGIAARTSVGKTSLLQSIEENFSHRSDAGQLLLTLEVTGEDWFERSLAIRLGVSAEEVEEAARQRDGFHSFAESLYESRRNARIVQRCSLEQLPTAIQRARAAMDVPLRLVLIDYLGLLEVSGRDAYERASKIGTGLKRVAKDERVAIVIAVQLSRAGGDGSEPVSIEMLRDSGVLEESCDFLLGCWRPGKAKGLSDEERDALENVLSVSILKNRRGKENRIVDLRFHPESRRLTELADPFATL